MNDSASLRNRLNTVVRDIPRSGIRDFFDIVTTMKDVISLGIGEPDFDTPWHVRESTVFALERGATHYTSHLGYIELRRAISSYIAAQFGPAYNPESEILITVGVSEALDLALRALINPGDEVLYHEPCYVSYRATILFAHGTPVEVETNAENGFRLTRTMLESKATARTKVLMLNFPNNPTGAIMSREDLEEIAIKAQQNGHDPALLEAMRDRLRILASRCQWVKEDQQRTFLAERVEGLWKQLQLQP
jgi:aminotransferase